MQPDPTTLDSWTWTPEPGTAARPGLTLTVLYHPDARRIGQTAALPFDEPCQVQRGAPDFAWEGARGRPLDDPYVSRKPLQFLPRGDGAAVTAPAGVPKYAIGGARGTGQEALTRDALARGVTLQLGRRVLLLVEWGVRPPGPRERFGVVGTSGATVALRASLAAAARVESTVLLLGETGTGKEVAARAVHAMSARSARPFVAVNLGAVPEATAASQLFGHARGAFTGATGSSPGFFGRAEGGVLFLDELGETPDGVQPQLLRAVDQAEVQPVGGPVRPCDVRLISATDADLHRLVEERRFRRALLFRMATRTIALVPLRERPADVAVQLVWFLEQALGRRDAARLLGAPREDRPPWLGLDVVAAFLDHDWPGNSRELRARAVALAEDQAGSPRAAAPVLDRQAATEAGPDHRFPDAQSRPTEPTGRRLDGSFRVASADPPRAAPAPAPPLTRDRIMAALTRWNHQVQGAARELGVGRNVLYAAMREHGMRVAGDLTAAEITAAWAAVGDVDGDVARHLGVSVTSLRRRIRKLGL